MPRHYKAQLTHQSFDWTSALDQIRTDLEARRESILETIGFYDEYERTNDPVRAEQINDESDGVMTEITGILATAGAIIVDGGFKPNRLLSATLQAVMKDPELIIHGSVESEARGFLQLYYQRGDETPGKHFYDFPDDRPAAETPFSDPDPDRVQSAANRAIAELKRSASKGRRNDVALARLTADLTGMYNRFAGPIKRTVAVQKLKPGQEYESSAFKDFLRLVLPALNGVLSQHSVRNQNRCISVEGVFKRARKLKSRPGDPNRT